MTAVDSLQKLLPRSMRWDAWRVDNIARAQKIALYWRYMDGDHDAGLTDKMREMLRIRQGDQFNINHLPNIVEAMSDRLTVDSIDGDNDAANEWIAEVMRLNRFDELQIDVHDDTLVAADSYVMTSWDNDAQRVVWTHEPAYDGTEGVLAVYDRRHKGDLIAAIKVWSELSADGSKDVYRANVYYPGRVEKWIGQGAGWRAYYDEDNPSTVYSDPDTGRQFMPWTTTGRPGGDPLGVPLIHFRNRSRGRDEHGKSELEDAKPIQDAINRNLHSRVMVEELSAFQIRYIIGWKYPERIEPGMAIQVYPKDKEGNPAIPTGGNSAVTDWLNSIRMGAIEQGAVQPYIDSGRDLRQSLYEVTGTPDYGQASSSSSGEALKQREIRLLSKIRRAQVKMGNAWENLAWLSAGIQAAFGTTPPASDRWSCTWRDAEIRNEKEAVETILAARDLMGDELTLRKLAPVLGLTEDDIQTALESREAETNRLMTQFAPTFTGADFDLQSGNPIDEPEDQEIT